MFLNTLKSICTLQTRFFVTAHITPVHLTETSIENAERKLLKVAIIGLPNAGKSTFINSIMDRKVCATSMKVHTTRNKATAVFTLGDSQIVFLDTPGLISDKEQKRYNLEKTFLRDSRHVSHEADVIGVVHDVCNVWTREKLDIKIINILEKHHSKPSFLVFNKVDLLKSKRKLLDLTRQVTGNFLNGKPLIGGRVKGESETKSWHNFNEIFMVSSLAGDGIQEVRDYLLKNAKPSEWLFTEDVWTDQRAETIISNTVKATFLDFIPQEIPYRVKTEVEYLKIDPDGTLSTLVNVNCPTERISKLIAGVGNGKLRQITEKTQTDIQKAFHRYVKIRIVLKYPEK